jgi:hypothetical protein
MGSVKSWVEDSGYGQALGVELVSLDEDAAELHLVPRPWR